MIEIQIENIKSEMVQKNVLRNKISTEVSNETIERADIFLLAKYFRSSLFILILTTFFNSQI